MRNFDVISSVVRLAGAGARQLWCPRCLGCWTCVFRLVFPICLGVLSKVIFITAMSPSALRRQVRQDCGGGEMSLWQCGEATACKTLDQDSDGLAEHGYGFCIKRVAKMGRITESQNVRGWKGPLWVTQPKPLPKQGHPQQAAQHRVQAGLEYLQRRRLHNLPGQPGPGLRHPQGKEVLPHVQMEVHYSN